MGWRPRLRADPSRTEAPGRLGLSLVLLGVVLLVLALGASVLFRGPAAPLTSVASPTPSAFVRATSAPTLTALPSDASATTAASTAGPVSGRIPTVASPTPSGPTSTRPAPSTAPGGSSLPIDPAVAAQIAEIEQQLPAIRGIQATEDVPNRIIDTTQLAQELRQQFAKDNPPADVAAEQDLLKRLGLVPQDADLVGLLQELYGSQVAGFYDPETRVFTLISRGEPFGPSDRVIVAHEYDHALQDQRFDLQKLHVTDRAEGDRALAVTSLIEGDATLAMTLWAQQHLTPDELAQVSSSGLDAEQQAVLDRSPILIRRQLLFPYSEGLQFVLGLFGAGGGFGGIDSAFGAPPATTEQILHPEKYASKELGVEVRPADLSTRLGPGWKRSTEQTMGELTLQVWAANGEEATSLIPGLPPIGPVPGGDAAAGWGGDRAVSYDGPDGQWAVVWETVWDTDADTSEFLAAANAVTTVTAPHAVIAEADPRRVTLIVASDAALLDQVRAARQP